jgi:arylsulfatase A-like enzyme
LLDALKSLVKSLPEPAIELIKRLLVRVKDVPDPRADCEELTDLAIDGFERNPGDSFMFIHYWDVHPPFRPPEGYAEQFEFDGEDRPLSYYFQPDRKGKKGGEYASYVNGDRETLAESKLAYDGTISWVDEQIGRLYEYLKESDRLKETLFIVTADHGHYFGEHDIFSDNCSLYDPSIQIPLIIHHPGEDPGRVEETVQHTDLRPTIHEFHGISLPEDIRGNILPAETREYGFAEAEGEIMQTIRTPDWKLIRPLDIDYLNSQYWYEQDGEVELYDLSEDPGEMQNLAKERPTRVSALNGLLDTEIEEQQTIEHSGDRGERDQINQEEIEQIQSNLESLGYIEDG